MSTVAPAADDSSAAMAAGIAGTSTAPAASRRGDPRFLVTRPAATGYGQPQTPTARPLRAAVVIPSNRPQHLSTWLRAWQPALDAAHATLYVVRDEPATWHEIADALGPDAWIIPRQTDCIRMWGYLQACRDGADVIITVDDDCLPGLPEDPIREHLRALTEPADPPGWGRTLPDVRTRGIPRQAHHPAINHGLWLEVPDLDAETQLSGPPLPGPERYPLEQHLTPGLQYPLSGMNLAWWRWWTPALYFGLMGCHLTTGAPWGMDRFGDIWAGLAAQRIADMVGATIRSGTPFVRHLRASDPHVNRVKEQPGHFWNPIYAEAIRTTSLLPHGTTDAYIATHAHALADAAARIGTGASASYWQQYGAAWHRWIDLTGD